VRVSHTFTRPFQSPETRCAPSASNASDPMIPACGMVGTISALKSDCALALDRHGSTSIDISAMRRAPAQICRTRRTPVMPLPLLRVARYYCVGSTDKWVKCFSSSGLCADALLCNSGRFNRDLADSRSVGPIDFVPRRSDRTRAALDKWLARNVRALPVQHNNVIASIFLSILNLAPGTVPIGNSA
jgi:hypothetical protein